MSRVPRREVERLTDVQQGFEDVAEIVGRGRAEFVGSRISQLAMMKAFEIIGDACSAVAPGTRAGHPEIPRRMLLELRNTMAHEYFHAVPADLWEIAAGVLPGAAAPLRKVRPAK